MEITIAIIVGLISIIIASYSVFIAVKIGYNAEIKKTNAEKQALINENIKLKETINEQNLRLDFLEEAMDLSVNCTSQFKNKSGDEIVVMRKERYNDYEAQEERLNIIEEKCVNMELVHESEDAIDYNKGLPKFTKPWNELTFNEFDKIKRKN